MDIDIPDITWSKPVTALVEKISTAIGVWWEPRQIVRMAKAEAERDRIRVESQIQITEIERRALNRFITEEAKKQENIEGIIRQALPQVEEKADPEKVEDDWLFNFFDKCRLISDAEMQRLWSRILAGEANAPGSFSKRTVNFLSSLDKTDAESFTNLCTFLVSINDGLFLLIFDYEEPVYPKHDITFDSLSHMDSIGLIQFDPLSQYGARALPKNLIIYYHRQPIALELKQASDNSITIGHVILTKVGQELAPICHAVPDNEFHDYMLKIWKNNGYIRDTGTQQDPT